MAEFSANFDFEILDEFWNEITAKTDLSQVFDLSQILSEIKALQHDQEQTWQKKVKKGFLRSDRYLIKAFMDDIEAPDIYIFGPRTVTDSCDESYTAICEAKGI